MVVRQTLEDVIEMTYLGYILHVGCPKCKQTLAVSIDTRDKLECWNTGCELFQIKFEMPTVTLQKVDK